MSASDKSDRAGRLRPEPAKQSQPKALIPSADKPRYTDDELQAFYWGQFA